MRGSRRSSLRLSGILIHGHFIYGEDGYDELAPMDTQLRFMWHFSKIGFIIYYKRPLRFHLRGCFHHFTMISLPIILLISLLRRIAFKMIYNIYYSREFWYSFISGWLRIILIFSLYYHNACSYFGLRARPTLRMQFLFISFQVHDHRHRCLNFVSMLIDSRSRLSRRASFRPMIIVSQA